MNIGDYPASITKWSLDVSACSLSEDADYIKTPYYAKTLWSRDLDGPAAWLSESIDVSTETGGTNLEIAFSEEGSHETSDYIDVYYQLDGGSFVRIGNFNNQGSDDHTLCDDFGEVDFSCNIPAGDALIIKVVFENNSSMEYLKMDDIKLRGAMQYASSTTSQNSAKIAAGQQNQQIIGIEVTTSSSFNPLEMTQFTVNMNGTTSPLDNKIENAKIFYTGTNAAFADTNQFGTTTAAPTAADFNISGSQELQEGVNYFWLCIDTKSGAPVGELIDAECTSFILAGNTHSPDVTAPAGSRTIGTALSGNYTIGPDGDYSSFSDAVSDLNNLGISGTTAFEVATGTYSEQISINEINGSSSTDTVNFSSETGNPADVVLKYEATSPQTNYVVKMNGADYGSFSGMSIQSTGSSVYGRVLVLNEQTEHLNFSDICFTGRDIDEQNTAYDLIFGEDEAENLASDIVFEIDTLRYGSSGLVFEGGDESQLESGLIFRNSAILDFYYMGMDLRYQDGILLHGNKISSKGESNTEFALFLWGIYGASEISANELFVSGTMVNYGIKMIECYGTSTSSILISNNFLSQEFTSGAYGMYIESCGYQDICHNSINLYASSKNHMPAGRSYETICLLFDYYYTHANLGHIQLKNNIANAGTHKIIDVSQVAADNNYLTESDYNDWYATGDEFGNWGSSSCEDLPS